MAVIEKLFFLAVRQLSKPIANRAKAAAENSSTFRSACIGVGRQLHRGMTQFYRWLDGKESLEHVRPLADASAVKLGTEVVSEFMVYGVACSTIVYEWRGTQKEKVQKEQMAAQEEHARRA